MSIVKKIIEENDAPGGFWFDIFIQSLIVISLVGFAVETLPSLGTETRNLLWYSQLFIMVIFTMEYVLRLFVADNKTGFVVSFYGVVDLLAILPFYFSTGLDLRGLRAFRLLRLFHAFKLVRYNRAIQRYHRALTISREELVLFLFVSALMIYFVAAGIYLFEHEAQPDKFTSIFHSLWWAVVTLTTVGYGDVVPVTVGGRAFTLLILIVAIGVISVPAGIIASALQEARSMEKADRDQDCLNS